MDTGETILFSALQAENAHHTVGFRQTLIGQDPASSHIIRTSRFGSSSKRFTLMIYYCMLCTNTKSDDDMKEEFSDRLQRTEKDQETYLVIGECHVVMQE